MAADCVVLPRTPFSRTVTNVANLALKMRGSLSVATGKVQGICGDTRNEADFVNFVQFMIEGHPGHEVYHFVSDQLNTHNSETLVRFVAEHCGFDEDLGIKGKQGILKSRSSSNPQYPATKRTSVSDL